MKIVRDEDSVPVSQVKYQKQRKQENKQNYRPKLRSNVTNKFQRPKENVRESDVRGKSNYQPGKKRQKPFSNECQRCGKDRRHSWNKGVCPAIGSTCSYCSGPNHWIAKCRHRNKVFTVVTDVDTSDIDSDNTEEEILDICGVFASTSSDKWSETVSVYNKDLKVRIDTGARCNTMTIEDYQNLEHQGELKDQVKY